MMELALEGDSDLIPTLQNELMTVRTEADIQASRAVNLDRENRELKAFINQYWENLNIYFTNIRRRRGIMKGCSFD